MGAREKLNAAHVNGALSIAGGIGLAAQSWLVFGVALAVFVGLAVLTGGIRLTPRQGR